MAAQVPESAPMAPPEAPVAAESAPMAALVAAAESAPVAALVAAAQTPNWLPPAQLPPDHHPAHCTRERAYFLEAAKTMYAPYIPFPRQL